MATLVEAWWPACNPDDAEHSRCTFYYAIINEEVWFVGHSGNRNGLRQCSRTGRAGDGFDHRAVTVDKLRNGTVTYYPVYTKGTLNLDTGDFNAS